MAFALPAPAPTFFHIPAPVFKPVPTFKALQIAGNLIPSKPLSDYTEAEFDDYLASLDASLRKLEPIIKSFFPHCKEFNCNG